MPHCRQLLLTCAHVHMPEQVQVDRERKWTERRTPWPDMQGFLTSQVELCQQRTIASQFVPGPAVLRVAPAAVRITPSL